MSSETPPGPPTDRPPEPFARGKITWGRPPQQVFRAGPLPSGGGVVPPAARPASRVDFLTGSMIPSARSAAASEPVETPAEPEAIAPPTPVEPEPVIEPVAAAPEPQEIVIEPEAAEPAVTVPPPLSGETHKPAKPRELPSVVVTPTLYATMGAAVQKAAEGGRWTIFAGIAAVVVIGGFIWLATLPAPQPIGDGPTPLAAGADPILETPMIEEAPPPAAVPSTPAPAARAPAAAAPAASTPVPATVAPRRPTPSAPVVIAPADAAPRPYIETAPLIVEPPTSAEPAQSDPDAPIATRPQPLD